MAKYEILIKAVTLQGMSYGEVAACYGVSKTLVHKLHHRWLAEGEAAFEPRSRRPATTLSATLENEAIATVENEATQADWLGDLSGRLGID